MKERFYPSTVKRLSKPPFSRGIFTSIISGEFFTLLFLKKSLTFLTFKRNLVQCEKHCSFIDEFTGPHLDLPRFL